MSGMVGGMAAVSVISTQTNKLADAIDWQTATPAHGHTL